MMFRSMTEAPNKKCGYVVDFKISRVLHACMSYNIHKKVQSTDEKIKYLINYNLINIDADYLLTNKKNSDQIISKIKRIFA